MYKYFLVHKGSDWYQQDNFTNEKVLFVRITMTNHLKFGNGEINPNGKENYALLSGFAR